MRTGPQTLTRKFFVALRVGVLACFVALVSCLVSAQTSLPSIRAVQDEALQAALTALRDNRLDEALKSLTAAEGEQPADARIRNFRGIVLARLGRSSEAAEEYREATRLDPKLEDAYKNLGFLEWSEHHLESARVQLEQALQLVPEDSFAHYYLGRVQLDAGQYESAFRELDRSGVTWPADAPFLIEAANGYLATGRQEKAREVLQRVSSMQLSDSEVGTVARFLLSSGDNPTAINLLRRLNERRDPACPRWAELDFALAYLITGDYGKAVTQSQNFIDAPQIAGASGEEAATAWSIAGIAKARMGEAGPAVSALRQASKIDSHREDHWLNLTRELMEVNREEAISAAQEGLKSIPESYALHLRLGAAYLSLDRYAEAESVFRHLVSSGDPLPTSYVGLAQVLMRTGRAEEAASELATAGKKLGPNFLIRYFQGLALDRAGQPAEAILSFREAVRLSPGSSEAHLGLGQTELRVGHIDEAIAELQKCLQINPVHAQARRLLSQAYRRAGDTGAALRYSQETEEKEPSPQNDLLGDFILPEWQGLQERAGQ